MWHLNYGINPERELITIEEVTSGKTNLVCPFCGCSLTAKKGKIKQHHFAHSGETCLRVRKGKFPSLPLYDNFHLHLSGKHFQLLKDLWREYGHTDYAIITIPFELEMKKLFSWTPEGYYFTDLGKIPVGGLSLLRFNAVQEPLILSELSRLTNSVEMAEAIGGYVLIEKLMELKIYRLQVQRILRLTLYFLQIQADSKTLHKIGVTSRDISDRLPEIERDLKQHYSSIDISVLETWQHRGNVELYFKHRYKEFNYRIDKLTEYYRFKDADAVLDDLCSMQPKTWSKAELEIWQDKTTAMSSSGCGTSRTKFGVSTRSSSAIA
jgi:T5orf172 domain